MFAIIKNSTDMRSPNYKIEFTTSKKKARDALSAKMKYTYDDPKAAKNWHNDMTTVYKMPLGWRRPTKSFIKKEVERKRGSIYSPNENGVMANEIFKAGYKIESESEI